MEEPPGGGVQPELTKFIQMAAREGHNSLKESLRRFYDISKDTCADAAACCQQEISNMITTNCLRVFSGLLLCLASFGTAHASGRATILYDAFGRFGEPGKRDWGFSALVEYSGKKILFDTGNNPDIFGANAQAM